MEQTAEIHGHEVIAMMESSGKSYSRDTLKADIFEKFGENTRFFTCAAEGLDADGLIDFLEERGKFVGESESFQFKEGASCDHE